MLMRCMVRGDLQRLLPTGRIVLIADTLGHEMVRTKNDLATIAERRG